MTSCECSVKIDVIWIFLVFTLFIKVFGCLMLSFSGLFVKSWHFIASSHGCDFQNFCTYPMERNCLQGTYGHKISSRKVLNEKFSEGKLWHCNLIFHFLKLSLLFFNWWIINMKIIYADIPNYVAFTSPLL